MLLRVCGFIIFFYLRKGFQILYYASLYFCRFKSIDTQHRTEKIVLGMIVFYFIYVWSMYRILSVHEALPKKVNRQHPLLKIV